MNINKTEVDKLIIPPKDINGKSVQKLFYDDKLKGFGIRVTSGGAKTFFIEKRINKKLKRIKIGRHGELTVDQARRNASLLLGQIAIGIDPLSERTTNEAQKITLEQTMNEYFNSRKNLKPKTIYDYKRIIEVAFSTVKNKPLISLTKDKISNLHEQLGEEHGHAYANLSMRILRALFNFAANHFEDSEGNSVITQNPVKRLSQTRSWYRVERRQSYIKSHELKKWYEATISLDSHIVRDYLILILMTGLRREEAAQLTWSDIDFKEKTLKINQTKNNESHTLPLSDYLFKLIECRYQKNKSDYLFPSKIYGQYLNDPRKQISKVREKTGIKFTIHDLRRTFITIAESLDIPAYALKRLLNHKMSGDVTAGYIMTDVERLRKPMQLITDYILKCFGLTQLNLIEVGNGYKL